MAVRQRAAPSKHANGLAQGIPSTKELKALLPKVELVDSDGVPMDSAWERKAMNLLIEQVEYQLRDRNDFYVGGNMFIYFSEEQAAKKNFRGPDFFFVKNVARQPMRRYWVVWQEGGRYPNFLLELISPITAKVDRTTKKAIYEETFRTPEYFLYDPRCQRLEGWRLGEEDKYQAVKPDKRGWLWSQQLQLWLGVWQGVNLGDSDVWPRFYDRDGNLVPTFAEAGKQRADAAKQRADAAKQRADAAEKEVAQLRARLAKLEKPK